MRIKFERPDIGSMKGHMLVDMHFHSRYSHDSSTPIPLIIDRCRELGVHVALTDHNSIQGVLEAERIAPGVVKPGVEVTTREGKDVLLYFERVEDLERFFEEHVRPHMKIKSSLRSARTSLPVEELLRACAGERCLVALAHPFAVGPRRSYRFFKNGHSDLLQFVDAFEVVNQAIHHGGNLSALGWAMQHGKAVIGGSDGHILKMLGSAFTCAPAGSWEGFLHAIRLKDALVVGEEQKLRHHVANMSRVLREKARVLENRRIRNGG